MREKDLQKYMNKTRINWLKYQQKRLGEMLGWGHLMESDNVLEFLGGSGGLYYFLCFLNVCQ